MGCMSTCDYAVEDNAPQSTVQVINAYGRNHSQVDRSRDNRRKRYCFSDSRNTKNRVNSADAWTGPLSGLPINALVSLARALALVDAMPGFYRGSVAPVIFVIQELSARHYPYQELHELIDWIRKHDPKNDYLPFGHFDP
jgi:hypothetical protein